MNIDLDRFTSRRSNTIANGGMVATSQPLAAQAGLSILQHGGNAFDASVATAAALNVVEPTSTGLGGDVFALYRTANGEVGAMRSCGHAPQGATIDTVRAALDGDPAISTYYPNRPVDEHTSREDLPMPFLGPHAITVPGTARGWEATIEELGTLSLADVLEPAIHYAVDGYPVSEVIAHAWKSAESLFTDPYAREAYLFDGSAPDTGQTVRLPDLGHSLQQIADRGADVVYEGAIADAIVDTVQSHGGVLDHDDLATFAPEFPDPISSSYRGVDIFQLPPNNQGMITLEALNIAEELDIGHREFDDPARLHGLIEATKLAFVDGHHYIADPEFEPSPPLHSKEYARNRSQTITDRSMTNPTIGDPFTHGEDADTVLLTVADDAGNVVSYINSRFAGFGSGLVAEGTGIALQNRGASFSLDSEHPNTLEPGKRPFHTLIPAIARFGDDDWAAFGTMGGFMQPQGHVQILTNMIDCGMSPQAALDAPRWRYQADGTVAVEERLSNLVNLARRGHDVQIDAPAAFGGAQFVQRQGETLIGATEPRKDGAAVGF